MASPFFILYFGILSHSFRKYLNIDKLFFKQSLFIISNTLLSLE